MFENLSISLNDSQKIAVQHVDGPLLTLAGVGSGKTKTITTRLAFLIPISIDSSSILTLTFTNKAATEMRERTFFLLGSSKMFTPPLLCTFHKFGLLFLKFHISELERENNFTIIDTDNKKRILESINKEIPSALLVSEVSEYKSSLISSSEVKATAQLKLYQEVAQTYRDYGNYLEKDNLVDFDDLLLLPYKILRNNENLAKQISQKCQYIMIDECQDTNELQYRFLRLLYSSHNNLCVVGDDDQSTYGWRGAIIKNISSFSNHFENSLAIKLENNYRSTDTILNHANQLIEHNRDRLGKKLIGTKTKDDSIRIYELNDRNDETRKIVGDIKKLIDSGENPKNIAILFRVNALPRSLEEGFNKAGLHYKLVGGMKFYERSEIKDSIAYFRTLTNLNDNFSIKRIMNKPKRGIGKTAIEKLEEKFTETSKSIFDLIQDLDVEGISLIVGKKNARMLKAFEASILDLRESLTQSKMRFLDNLEEAFDYRASYDNLPGGLERQANIDEFYGHIRDYSIQNPHLDLKDPLNEIALENGNDDYSGGAVSMMSVRASKGLEFKHLFIIGLEEGFFLITGDGSDLKRERRLGYVAITRTKDNLTLSFVHSRFYRGKGTVLSKSRFLSESGLIKGGLTIQKQVDFKKDDTVSHEIFGIGRVEKVTSAGEDYKLTIDFGGTKRDILSSFVEKA